MRATSRRAPWGPRTLLRAALVGVLLTLSFGIAAPAQAATINCTPMADPSCKDLTPLVNCIWNNGDGTSTVVWGYDNPSTDTLTIDFGGKNKMATGPDDQGQGNIFTPGLHNNAFTTTFSGTIRTWTLGNNKVSSSASSPACPTKPVSVIGSWRALLLGIALALAIGLPVVAARRRGREVLA
ncbi:MAG: hypothetical protein QOF58_8240 [Pseudonocardiales bacterium]|nr:hypothetical protein [Pseudonocardiales bacterium]